MTVVLVDPPIVMRADEELVAVLLDPETEGAPRPLAFTVFVLYLEVAKPLAVLLALGLAS